MPRVKKLTDYAYSPTNPASEDAIRTQIDDSIQEVYDAAAKTGDTVSLTSDQTVTGIKTFSSSPIVPTPTTEYQASTKKYVDDGLAGALIGELPEGSVTNPYLGSDVKVGSLATLNTTVKTDVISAVNEVDGNVYTNTTNISNNSINLDILRIAKIDTGAADAYLVDTAGTFDRTIEGNLLHFIPSNTNTGASTISEDSQTAKAIKKFDIGTDAYIDLEAEDLKKNTLVQLTWSAANDFFVYAPKGGSNIKSIQRGTILTNSATTLFETILSNIDVAKSILIFSFKPMGTDIDDCRQRLFTGELLDVEGVKKVRFLRQGTSVTEYSKISWEVIEFNNVKSKQSGTNSHSASIDVSVSNVNMDKSMLLHCGDRVSTSTAREMRDIISVVELTSSTNVFIDKESTGEGTITNWNLIEFN